MEIRPITHDDIAAITDLYNWYILNTIITFEVEVISQATMEERVAAKVETYDWLVGILEGQVIGYAYYGAFHPRAAYGHTVEGTIYLAPEHQGQGWGTALYQEIIALAQGRGFREMMSLIALPNPGSAQLHRKLGFREVGVLQQVGYKCDRYIDVAIWQKSLLPSNP